MFVRADGEEVGRNRQTFFVEPGKFGYRLVRGELEFPEPGTIEARCTILESGSAVTVPLTALPVNRRAARDPDRSTRPHGAPTPCEEWTS